MVRERSRRMSFIATRLRTRRSTSSNTARSAAARRTGRGPAAAQSRRCQGKTFSSHQVATSGNDSSRSVSPVGAQSTITQSNSSSSWWRLIWSSENSSSMPGGTVSSSAEMRSTPRSASSSPSQSCTASQWRSISSCACTSWPHRLWPDVRRLGARAPPPASPTGCARGRWRARPCAAPRRRSGARWLRRRSSCRLRPCPCRGSCGAPWRRPSYVRRLAPPRSQRVSRSFRPRPVRSSLAATRTV